ncbi:MAG: ABC transporter permease [Lachnospiraceae bacterium]|nr:ABC transporter permease [Lachnospiraceae bacterium]
MKNNTLTIMKKELARFFRDKRMVFTTILMPGLMIYVLYTFMGNTMMKEFLPDDSYVASAYVQNMPEEMEEALVALSAEWTEIDAEEAETVKQSIQDKEADVLVIFPENFLQAVQEYDVTSGTAAPNVEIYYNSTETQSDLMYDAVRNMLSEYENTLANKLDVNVGDKDYDCATDRDLTAMMFSMMLPMLLMIFLYSGCISVAPESIAGEKERGTIATLLVTPMKRSSLALGKVFSLSIIALLSGISSFLGTFLSLPQLMGGETTGIDTAVYGVTDFVMLLGIILSTVLVLVSIISVISAFSKSIKEAGTAVSPLMIVVMFISLLPMFGGDMVRPIYSFVIPLYNSVMCMNGIFSFTYEPLQVGITILANILCTGILSFVLTKIFNSEKAMFTR